MLGTIEEVIEEVADIAKHLELLGEAKNMRAFTSLPDSKSHCFGREATASNIKATYACARCVVVVD